MIDINNGDDLSDREINELTEGRDDASHLRFVAATSSRSKNRKIEALAELGLDVEITNPIEFLHKVYPGRSIFRYIQSHPDLDHMRGLAALLDSGIKIHNFWDCPHDKQPDFRDGKDEEDWEAYLSLSSGTHGATVLNPRRGSSQKFYNQNEDGTSGGDGLSILSPSSSFHASCRESEDTNNSSYVLHYSCSGIKVIFGGDAEDAAWEEMYKLYGQTLFPKCHILKASHHGRDSGYNQKSVKAMNPQYTIVSAGKKPDSEVCAKYSQYCDNVWTTRWNGNIHVEIEASGKATIRKDRDA